MIASSRDTSAPVQQTEDKRPEVGGMGFSMQAKPVRAEVVPKSWGTRYRSSLG